MTPFQRLNIRGRVIAILLVVGGSSALVTAYQGYQSGKDNLTARITA